MVFSDVAARNFRQEEHLEICVSTKDSTERVQLVEYDAKQGLTRTATEAVCYRIFKKKKKSKTLLFEMCK